MTESPRRVRTRVIVIDDDTALAQTFRLCLEDAGYYVETADRAVDGERAAARQPFDVCLLDWEIGHDSGLESLPKLRQLAPGMRIVMVSGRAGVDDAMFALRSGADDYLAKPCTPAQLLIAVARQAQARRLERRVEALERDAGAPAVDLDSRSSAMREVIEAARTVSTTDANILILGPSGTGKGVLARAIHR